MTATPAAAATGTVTGLAGKCLDVTGNSAADGAKVQLWTCTGADNQKWNAPAQQQSGEQCWATHYGPQPPGALTASGEVFDNNADTAAP
jgi:rare lipoprotein A (peptidoglycan hydrolase)